MLQAILALTIASAPSGPEAPVDGEHRVAIFAQPLLTAAGLAGFAVPSIGMGFGLSGGAQFVVNESWGLTFDAAGLLASAGQNEDFRGVTSGAFSLGPTFRMRGSGLSGFFVTPKIYAVVASNWTDFGPSPIRGTNGFTRWTSFETGAGVDLALQWTNGHFFIGTVFGFGAGIGFGAGSPLSTFSSTLFGGANTGGFVLSLNVHLLRIGYTF